MVIDRVPLWLTLASPVTANIVVNDAPLCDATPPGGNPTRMN
jgi:hypothetical protein